MYGGAPNAGGGTGYVTGVNTGGAVTKLNGIEVSYWACCTFTMLVSPSAILVRGGLTQLMVAGGAGWLRGGCQGGRACEHRGRGRLVSVWVLCPALSWLPQQQSN